MKRVLFIAPSRTSRDILSTLLAQEAKNAEFPLDLSSASEKEGIARMEREDFDLVLLCPNLRFLLNEPRESAILGRAKVHVVGSNILGSLDSLALLRIINADY